MGDVLIRVEGLTKHFPIRGKWFFSRAAGAIRAVTDVSLSIQRGDTFALMGESGCGKTTCGLTMIRLLEPTSGQVFFDGQDIFTLKGKELWALRRDFQIVFQNPQEVMDPLVSVRSTIEEPLIIHHPELPRKKRKGLVREFANAVGLRDELLKRYPRELSGGEQQRVCICRALILKPQFVVLDEPTSALDVSVQARALNLLMELKGQFGLTYVFISHDAAVVRWMADNVGVLYLGRLVELGPTEAVFSRARHPYTSALIQSVLTVGSRLEEKQVVLKGAPPSPTAAPTGCVFYKRCPEHRENCAKKIPPLVEIERDHWVACDRRAG